jgi:hypothetical protein
MTRDSLKPLPEHVSRAGFAQTTNPDVSRSTLGTRSGHDEALTDTRFPARDSWAGFVVRSERIPEARPFRGTRRGPAAGVGR